MCEDFHVDVLLMHSSRYSTLGKLEAAPEEEVLSLQTKEVKAKCSVMGAGHTGHEGSVHWCQYRSTGATRRTPWPPQLPLRPHCD